MRILAVIPARGRSVRLAGKNVRPLGGKPLVVWSIDSATAAPGIDDVIVSTDDEAIAGIAREAGALVPWLRPAHLATDTARSVDVVLHAVDWYERERHAVDGVLMLQPTSPLRTQASLQHGIDLFRAHGGKPVIGVSPAASHPLWCFTIDGQTLRPFIAGPGLHLRSQDLPPAYVVNGAFYLATPQDVRRHQTFFADNAVPLVMEAPEESVDIDTEADWTVAEALLGRHRRHDGE